MLPQHQIQTTHKEAWSFADHQRCGLQDGFFQAADNVPGVTTGEVNGATEGFEPVLSHVQQYASACDQLVTEAGIKQVLLESTGA